MEEEGTTIWFYPRKEKAASFPLCLWGGSGVGRLLWSLPVVALVKICLPVYDLTQVYLREAPWPSAQSEIRTISAYKTPRDKVQCILRMCSTIMNLLSLANEDSVPGADDFVPVLVFVLIKVGASVLLAKSLLASWAGWRRASRDVNDLGSVLPREKVSDITCCSVQKLGFSKEKVRGPVS